MRAAGILCFFSAWALRASAKEPEDEEGSPITKVVELIAEMKTKIVADGEAEQELFDKYACWCEETTARKSANIVQAMKDIKRLGTTILQLKGRVSMRDHEMTVLRKEISENEDAQRAATTLRQKENSAFQEKKVEMETTIGSLEKGIMVLSGAGTKKASLLEQKGMMARTKKSMRQVVKTLPHDSDLSGEQMRLLTSFLDDPSEYYDQKAQKAASYSPASSTIMGILKDMYDTFVSNLEKETNQESDGQKYFEDLMAVKEKEMKSLQAELEQRTSQKAEAATQLSDASQELDDATKQMQADTEFFHNTKAACTKKADEWSERVRARTEELAGIDKAVEILTSDDAKALFGKAIKPGMEKMFLQTSSSVDDTPRMKAFALLKKHAKNAHSARLAVIAMQIRATTSGHFDKVVEEIDKMLQVLKDEEKADINHRDWCKEETFKNEQEASRYEYKVGKTEAAKVRLETQLEELENTLATTVEEIQSTKDEIKQMEDERLAEHKAFETAKSDDEGAVELLEKAVESLSSFYKNNPPALLQKPEFGDEDTAPDSTFSDKNKSKGENKGIVSILTMIKEDLEAEISNGVKGESAAHADFEAAMINAKKVLKALNEKKTNLKASIVDTNKQIDETQDDVDELKGLLEDEKKYLLEIKPDCDWIMEEFMPRRNARTEEMNGLVDAKALLFSAAAEAHEEANSELQRGSLRGHRE